MYFGDNSANRRMQAGPFFWARLHALCKSDIAAKKSIFGFENKQEIN
jgi:hypothetical protein